MSENGMNKEMYMAITLSKGIRLKFQNGYELSIQIGPGNYCDNYNMEIGSAKNTDCLKSSTAELAAFNKNGNWFDFQNKTWFRDDTIDGLGYAPINEVIDWINYFNNLEG